MASKPPVRIVDHTTNAELTIDANGNAQVNAEGRVAAGSAIGTTRPIIIAGADATNVARTLRTDANGYVLTTPATTTAAAVTQSFATTASIAAAGSATVNGPELAAGTHTLLAVTVGSEQPYFFTLHTVVDAVVTQVCAPVFGPSNDSKTYSPLGSAVIVGGTAGADNWRVVVTNNDSNKAATASITFIWQSV